VAIARSLAMAPTLMLFDEITSALDPELVGEVLRVLEKMADDGMTMMLVTHEMNFARRVADRVIFMHEGRVWEQNSAREFFEAPKTDELKSFLGSVIH
jgi:polar amino acid transport system ATP-binding protein